MGWLIALLWLLCAPILLWTMIDPRSAWQKTTAWRYDDPRANRPSDAAFGVQRVTAGIGLFLCVVMSLVIVSVARQQHRATAERAARGPEGSTESGVHSYRLGAGNQLVLNAESQSLDEMLHSKGSGCVLTARIVNQTDTAVTVSARLEPVLAGDGTTCATTYGEYGEVTVTLDGPLGKRQVFDTDHTAVPYRPG